MKRDEQRRATQAAIFDAAIALFDVQGYAQTSVDEICAKAGVGRATFFRHFEVKSGLVREFNRRIADDATARLAATRRSVSSIDRLRVVADALHDAWAVTGPGFRELAGDAISVGDPTGARTRLELQELLRAILRDGRDNGDLSLRLPPSLTAYTVLHGLLCAAAWWVDNPDEDLRELIDGAVEYCLHGIAAPSPAPKPTRRR